MVLKLERFSHLSDRSFGLNSPIRLEALSHMVHHVYLRDLPYNAKVAKLGGEKKKSYSERTFSYFIIYIRCFDLT